MRWSLLAVLVVAGAVWGWQHGIFSSPPLHQSVNQPGKPVDVGPLIRAGKTTVVHYYADWCPACANWADTMKAVEAQFPDIHVAYVNIDSFDSPVAQQHRIGFVPNFKVYDRRGRLIAEDKAADQWLRDEIHRRLAARGMAAARLAPLAAAWRQRQVGQR